jgi:hypothetical protein
VLQLLVDGGADRVGFDTTASERDVGDCAPRLTTGLGRRSSLADRWGVLGGRPRSAGAREAGLPSRENGVRELPSELLGQALGARGADRPGASDLPATARPADVVLPYGFERSAEPARCAERGRSDGPTGEPYVRALRVGVRAVDAAPEAARPPLADLGLLAFAPAFRGPAGFPPAFRGPAGFPPAFRVLALVPDDWVPLARTGRRSGNSGMRNAPFQRMPKCRNALRATRERVTLNGKMSGGVLLSHAVARAVPSAQRGLASGFGMGPGVSLSL